MSETYAEKEEAQKHGEYSSVSGRAGVAGSILSCGDRGERAGEGCSDGRGDSEGGGGVWVWSW